MSLSSISAPAQDQIDGIANSAFHADLPTYLTGTFEIKVNILRLGAVIDKHTLDILITSPKRN